jgi:hypothetical protein
MGLVVAEISAADEALVPAYVLQLPDSVDAVLIAETDSAKLHRYERVQDILKHRETRYMSIGENGVGKERAWDRRTPLGIYFANEQLDTSRMHDKYGPMAFPLDYPNAWDEVNARTGDGIWIHGVDRNGGRRPPLDTDGCIALPNEDLLELEAQIQLLTTPRLLMNGHGVSATATGTRICRCMRPASCIAASTRESGQPIGCGRPPPGHCMITPSTTCCYWPILKKTGYF